MIGETRYAEDLPQGIASEIVPIVARPLGVFAPLEVTVVRPLTDEDILDALGGQVLVAAPTLTTIRHAHHRIAMLLCEGKSAAAVSLITGYSPPHINRLQRDPMFKELLDYYSAQVVTTHVDTLERMKTLNLTALEELSERLETDPGAWTKKDLMDLARLTTPLGSNVGAGAGSSASSPPPSGVAITVQFVTPQAPGFSAEEAKIINPNGERYSPETEI